MVTSRLLKGGIGSLEKQTPFFQGIKEEGDERLKERG